MGWARVQLSWNFHASTNLRDMTPIWPAALERTPVPRSTASRSGQIHGGALPIAFPKISLSNRCSRSCIQRTRTCRWRPTWEILGICPWRRSMTTVSLMFWRRFGALKRGGVHGNYAQGCSWFSTMLSPGTALLPWSLSLEPWLLVSFSRKFCWKTRRYICRLISKDNHSSRKSSSDFRLQCVRNRMSRRFGRHDVEGLQSILSCMLLARNYSPRPPKCRSNFCSVLLYPKSIK